MQWKFDCNACKKYVEQGAAPEQLYVEFMDGNILQTVQYQACSPCAREIKAFNEKREKQYAEEDRNKPPKKLPERPADMPEKFFKPQAEVEAAMERGDGYPMVNVQPDMPYPLPPNYNPNAPIPKAVVANGGDGASPPKQDALAMILATMVETQQQMLRSQEHTNQLLEKLAQPRQQQQQKPPWKNKKNFPNGTRPR